jgi:hypothetical protein
MLCTRTAVLATAFAFFLSVAVAVSMPNLLGGHSEASTESQDVQQAAKFAVAQLSGKNDFSSDGKLTLKRVVSAKHQVVAGVNYHLTIETEDGSGKVQQVDVTVWQKPVQSGSNELPMELTHFKVSGPAAE